MKGQLNQKFVGTVSRPTGKLPVRYADGSGTGLLLVVKPSGGKSWIQRTVIPRPPGGHRAGLLPARQSRAGTTGGVAELVRGTRRRRPAGAARPGGGDVRRWPGRHDRVAPPDVAEPEVGTAVACESRRPCRCADGATAGRHHDGGHPLDADARGAMAPKTRNRAAGAATDRARHGLGRRPGVAPGQSRGSGARGGAAAVRGEVRALPHRRLRRRRRRRAGRAGNGCLVGRRKQRSSSSR